jgi:ornithine carbamoyltransferase
VALNLKGRSFLTLKDYTAEEIECLIDQAHRLKQERRKGILGERFRGRNLALLFEKRSTRTRCAFETAFAEEGGHPVFLSTQDIHLGEKECIEDTARVLGRMFDAIQFRGFEQKTVERLAEYAGIPVYNGLTDAYHPTQILADLMTIEEEFKVLKGRRVVYVGDGRNNVANSLLIGCAKLGLHCTVVAPPALHPEGEHLAYCQEIAREQGTEVTVSDNIEGGVRGADVIYTDVWVSLGEEAKEAERVEILRPYQVNERLMKLTGMPQTIFLHCLPAVKGNEVTFEVIEGPQSRVWDQAENRKHTIKALMIATI